MELFPRFVYFHSSSLADIELRNQTVEAGPLEVFSYQKSILATEMDEGLWDLTTP